MTAARSTCGLLGAENENDKYERVCLGLPVKGGGVTGGPVKQVMSDKREGKGFLEFSVVSA